MSLWTTTRTSSVIASAEVAPHKALKSSTAIDEAIANVNGVDPGLLINDQYTPGLDTPISAPLTTLKGKLMSWETQNYVFKYVILNKFLSEITNLLSNYTYNGNDDGPGNLTFLTVLSTDVPGAIFFPEISSTFSVGPAKLLRGFDSAIMLKYDSNLSVDPTANISFEGYNPNSDDDNAYIHSICDPYNCIGMYQFQASNQLIFEDGEGFTVRAMIEAVTVFLIFGRLIT